MAIDLDTLKSERTKLKTELRELEQEQRKLDAELKKFRQRELQTKRQIEALTTLIDVNDTSSDASRKASASASASTQKAGATAADSRVL